MLDGMLSISIERDDGISPRMRESCSDRELLPEVTWEIDTTDASILLTEGFYLFPGMIGWAIIHEYYLESIESL